jgi:hypothetical protein
VLYVSVSVSVDVEVEVEGRLRESGERSPHRQARHTDNRGVIGASLGDSCSVGRSSL